MSANASSEAGAFVPGMSQADPRPGIVDLGPGYLDPALLPTALMRHCVARALDRWGAQTLSYGANAGPLELRAELAARVARADGRPCGPGNVLTTAGTSAALDQIAVRLARDGRVLLTESLTYDLGRMIFQSRGVRTVAVPGPLDDIDVDELDRAARRAGRAFGRPPALYLIPTFHNPTGRVLGLSRRKEIVALAERLGLLIIEDLAYLELSFGATPPPSLWSCATDQDQVITLYSVAKCLAPGIRVGWMVGGERLVAEFAADPARQSGGGANHFAVVAVAVACLEGGLDLRIASLRERLRIRRDALIAGIDGTLPKGYEVGVPAGGYFAWLRLPPEVDEERLLREAEARGVSFAPGRRFGTADRGVRLCFATCGAGDLRLGAARLVAACRAHE